MMQGMRNTSFLLLAMSLGGVGSACGSDFSGADSVNNGTSGSDGSVVGSGGSAGGSSGSPGSGGSMAGSGPADDSGSSAPEGGAIASDAKLDAPRVSLDAASDRASTSDGGTACLSSTDCAAGLDCLFDIKGGCSVVGVCMKGFDPTKPICNAISNSCSCSGHTVNVICNGLPNGYYSEPIAHSGAC